jgi:hypothetical protein
MSKEIITYDTHKTEIGISGFLGHNGHLMFSFHFPKENKTFA